MKVIQIFKFLLLLQSIVLLLANVIENKKSFVIGKDAFYKDGKPYRIKSGSVHYFRYQEEDWLSIISYASQCGLNTIETYIPWNLHHPLGPKESRFDGMLNVRNFIEGVALLNMTMIVRIGPFNDAELDYGGLPLWLVAEDIPIRTKDPRYLKYVDEWVSELSPILAPYLYKNGGPILMIQVENEYGIVGCDIEYIQQLEKIFKIYFPDTILFTTDPCDSHTLSCGNGNKTTSLFATMDFGPGTDINKCITILETYQPNKPLMNSEFYTGWFTAYGDNKFVQDIKLFETAFGLLVNSGMSYNLYMFAGGTNFEFYGGTIAPWRKLITSYDYDAPINEAGNPTEKYVIIHKINNMNGILLPLEKNYIKNSIVLGPFNVTSYYDFLGISANLTSEIFTNMPSGVYLEHLHKYNGFTLFQTTLPTIKDKAELKIKNLHDQAVIILNSRYAGRTKKGEFNMTLNPLYSNRQLNLLHSSYGHFAMCSRLEYKTLGNVTIDGQELKSWDIRLIDLSYSLHLGESNNEYVGGSNVQPHVLKVKFFVNETVDTCFLQLGQCFLRGYVFLNNFNLGYYDNISPPQKTLLCPSSKFQLGENTLTIFEYYGIKQNESILTCQVQFMHDSIWDHK